MKIQTFEIVHPGQEQFRAPSAQEMIALMGPRSSEGEKREVINAISEESDQIVRACRQEQQEKLAEAEAAEKVARAKAERHRPRLVEGEQTLRQQEAEPGSLSKAATFILGFVACFIAEFVLTWYTLPFILSVKQFSFVGLMLAIAPTTAVVILAVPLARLIEKPWQKAQAGLSTMRRNASWIVMTAFLLGLSALNVYTVFSVAEAREEAMKAKRNLERMEGEGEVAVDTAALNRAILLVGICVAFDGAFFHLIGMAEWKRLSALWRRRREVTRLRSDQDDLDWEQAEAEARLAVQRERWGQIDAHAEAVAGQYCARLLFQLEQALNRPLPRQPARELVDEILVRKFNAKTDAKSVVPLSFAPPNLPKQQINSLPHQSLGAGKNKSENFF